MNYRRSRARVHGWLQRINQFKGSKVYYKTLLHTTGNIENVRACGGCGA
jgi:hypothetical protein